MSAAFADPLDVEADVSANDPVGTLPVPRSPIEIDCAVRKDAVSVSARAAAMVA